MLGILSIRDMVLIEAVDLRFAPGLNVLTGETGAGKTMMVQSLSLLLGRRAESGWVRHGADSAVVTGVYEVSPGQTDHPALRAVEDAGGVVEDGTHDELLAAGGEYARMFTLQASRFAGDGPDDGPHPDQEAPGAR